MTRAVALMSGGLDSQLAVALMLRQGVEVIGIHFSSVFNTAAKDGGPPSAVKAAQALGIELMIIDISAEQIAIVKNPKHGLGSAANPCIDCHIFMLRRAKGLLKELNADFIVTGEVVGQRPMSQRRQALDMIAAATGFADIILRPLSARALEPTKPERDGLVDRNGLLDIVGRSRKRQMALAAELGVVDYPSPAGGCLLTDPGFGFRVKDLLAHNELDIDNARLLKIGRHYRLPSGAKVVVGRNAEDNEAMETLCLPGDAILIPADIPGPTALLRGGREGDIEMAVALAMRASKAKDEASARMTLRRVGADGEQIVTAAPATDEIAERLTINPQ